MLIELTQGFYVDPELVAVVKDTGVGACALFLTGQSALDGGFTLAYPASEVAEQINDALKEMYEDGDHEGEGEVEQE